MSQRATGGRAGPGLPRRDWLPQRSSADGTANQSVRESACELQPGVYHHQVTTLIYLWGPKVTNSTNS